MYPPYLRTTYRGFSLTEMLVSLFVFGLAMTGVAQIFSSSFSSYRVNRSVQYDVETAQHTLNIMAKELRTSSVVSASASHVKFYDHSQGKCFHYRISGAALQVASAQVNPASQTKVSDCNSMAFAAFKTISTGTVTGSFQVTPSVGGANKVVGKVTISLDISEGTHHALIQTSVSLRDFGNIGL